MMPLAQRKELPPYDETRCRFALPCIPKHGRAHGQRVELVVLGLPITVGTLEGLYFKSHLTFGEITSSGEARCPWYRRFPPLGTRFPHDRAGCFSPYTRRRKGRNGPPRRVCRGTGETTPRTPVARDPWRAGSISFYAKCAVGCTVRANSTCGTIASSA